MRVIDRWRVAPGKWLSTVARPQESTDYGDRPGAIDLPEDEIGDALFALLALADGLGVDAGEALSTALAKYERRMEETGSPSSGE